MSPHPSPRSVGGGWLCQTRVGGGGSGSGALCKLLALNNDLDQSISNKEVREACAFTEMVDVKGTNK